VLGYLRIGTVNFLGRFKLLDGYYDFGRSLPNYDVVSFLCALEQERIRLGEDKVSITFIPGSRGGFGFDRLWPDNIEQRIKLRDNVAMPLCRLLPSCASIALASSREGQRGFGVGRWWGGPSHIAGACTVGVRPLRSHYKIDCGVDNIVTITLREAEHWPVRNSNVAEWIKAALHIRKQGFKPVFIRDTCKAYELIEGFDCYPKASLSIAERSRLYASAILNMGVSNGPVWLALCMDVPLAMLRPVEDSKGGTCATSVYFERCGIPRGGQVPGSPDYQQLFWTSDRSFEIINAFKKMIGIDSIWEGNKTNG
jgi:hypothetical protein